MLLKVGSGSLKARKEGRKVCFILDPGGGGFSVQGRLLPATPDNQWARAVIVGRRGLHTGTSQAALTLLTGGMTSVILVVLKYSCSSVPELACLHSFKASSRNHGSLCRGCVFPHSSVGKESACDSGGLALIPGWGRSPGEGNGNPLRYSHLENPMDRGAWRATVHGIARVGHDFVIKPPRVLATVWSLCS